MCLSIFTEEYIDILIGVNENNPGYIEVNGRLYYLDGALGGAFGYAPDEYPDEFELISKTDTEIHFNLIGHYNSSNVDENYQVEIRKYPISFVKTINGWRISEFHLAS